MTVMVALLRGINVGGRGKLPMADLRRMAEGCGYQGVRTYIQSGNVVLDAGADSPEEVATRLRAAIAVASDVDPEVVVRTRHELAEVVASNPYLARGEDPAHLHVTFTDGGAEEVLAAVDTARYLPEEASLLGRELYMLLPGGIGRSKLAADLSRRAGGTGTTRNWRTVAKLLELADDTA